MTQAELEQFRAFQAERQKKEAEAKAKEMRTTYREMVDEEMLEAVRKRISDLHFDMEDLLYRASLSAAAAQFVDDLILTDCVVPNDLINRVHSFTPYAEIRSRRSKPILVV